MKKYYARILYRTRTRLGEWSTMVETVPKVRLTLHVVLSNDTIGLLFGLIESK
jgi:hypothetical protein